MSEKTNWVITLTKPSHLEEVRYLASQEALPQVLAHLLQRHPAYSLEDSITIKPTDLVIYE